MKDPLANGGQLPTSGPTIKSLTPIIISPEPGDAVKELRYLFAVATAQLFLSQQKGPSFDLSTYRVTSDGFAISYFIAAQLNIAAALGPVPKKHLLANRWMNSQRLDYVNADTSPVAQPDERTGCAILFYNFMLTQIGLDLRNILRYSVSNLAAIYQVIIRERSEDPFGLFKRLLDHAFPISIPVDRQDDPFPLAILSFVINTNTFGMDAVIDALSTSELD